MVLSSSLGVRGQHRRSRAQWPRYGRPLHTATAPGRISNLAIDRSRLARVFGTDSQIVRPLAWLRGEVLLLLEFLEKLGGCSAGKYYSRTERLSNAFRGRHDLDCCDSACVC